MHESKIQSISLSLPGFPFQVEVTRKGQLQVSSEIQAAEPEESESEEEPRKKPAVNTKKKPASKKSGTKVVRV